MSYETYRAAANQLAIVTIELQVRRSIEALQAVVPVEKHSYNEHTCNKSNCLGLKSAMTYK